MPGKTTPKNIEAHVLDVLRAATIPLCTLEIQRRLHGNFELRKVASCIAHLSIKMLIERVGEVPTKKGKYGLYQVTKAPKCVPARGGEAVSESLQWRYCDAHGTGPEYAWGCPECVRELRRALKAAESRANELNAMLEHCRDEAAETERMLRAEYANAESRAEETRRLYDELLYQVSMKHLGESRHQTALRYLRQSESNVCWPDSAALAEGEAG